MTTSQYKWWRHEYYAEAWSLCLRLVS